MGKPKLFGNKALIRQSYLLEHEKQTKIVEEQKAAVGELHKYKVYICVDYDETVTVYAKTEKEAEQKALIGFSVSSCDLDINATARIDPRN